MQWLAEEDNRKYENDKANMESRKAAIKERLLALPDWNEQLYAFRPRDNVRELIFI